LAAAFRTQEAKASSPSLLARARSQKPRASTIRTCHTLFTAGTPAVRNRTKRAGSRAGSRSR